MLNETPNTTSQKRILIVDDEPGILELLRDILSMHGYLTVSAATGDEAIVRSREQHFDIALIDLLMPGTSGADVARVMSDESPQTVIVIVTGSDPETVQRELEGVLVDLVIRKPFDIDEVLSAVARLTEGS